MTKDVRELIERLRQGIDGNIAAGIVEAEQVMDRAADALESLSTPVASEEEVARLRRIENAARDYFTAYLQDEATELELCLDSEQHRLAVELQDALAARAAIAKATGK